MLAASYLLGSIPFSFLVARFFGVADVRRAGSGNVGATNVLRTAGKTAGVLAFVLDAGKGAAAAWLALALERQGWLGLSQAGASWAPWAALSAVVGHLYPVWLGFKGGKGVATGAGAFLPLAPVATLASAAVFALLLAWLRYVSLASLCASLALALLVPLLGAPREVGLAAGVVSALVVFRHRENIARLLAGTERRAGSVPTEAQQRAAQRRERDRT